MEIHSAMYAGTSKGESLGFSESNEDDAGGMEGSRRRRCRAEHWRPVYSWLESLDTAELVSKKDVKDWFRANPDIEENLARHTRYHLPHYIRQVHMKMLKRKGKLQKDKETYKRRKATNITNDGSMENIPIPCPDSREISKSKNLILFRKDEALRRYELLSELQNHLQSLLSKGLQSPLLTERPAENASCPDGNVEKENKGAMKPEESLSKNIGETFIVGAGLAFNGGLKRKSTMTEFTPAWSYCEVPSGNSARESTENFLRCLQGREQSASWASSSRGAYVGRNKEKWIPFLQGWKTLGRQFEGPAVVFERRSYSSWVPTWCAYSSSAAVAQPFGRTDQSVQKVLDVRFHPAGLPQLVCSSNEAPNELLLYNLLSGKAVELSGHNCQVQAVEFSVRGASIVSCGGNLVKVWDATTGSCLYTLGPGTNRERSSIGHTKKISAMTVNAYESCLVATSGGLGDGKLLLWNALTGELTSDLNEVLRSKSKAWPSIEAMEFFNLNTLICGSDSSHGGPAVVQMWDVESPQSGTSIPANNSYITSLKTNPDWKTIITGAGDGAVDLYDIRTCSAISHLSVGSGYEVTSVAFSKCGTYFHASSTSNSTMVWDTRLMPMTRGHRRGVDHSSPVNGLTSSRPLHCLSHGKQMPTAEHAGQLPGHVDEGDQGVNDAKWLQRESILVTVSGDGSIAMWDVALGKPCIRHLMSHTRCVNTVAVAPNDEYLCTGGDDQKVVLYDNGSGTRSPRWRLSHPL